MSFSPQPPNSQNLCGAFTDPATEDSGRAYPPAIVQSCAAPTGTVGDPVDVVWIDGRPFFDEAPTISTGDGVSYAEFNYVGDVTDETIFGGFTAPQALRIHGMQINAQDPPTGDDLEICLVDEDDAEIAGTTAVLTAGEAYESTTWDDPITLASGGVVKAKIKQIGATYAGGYLNVRLVIGPAS